MSDLLDDPAPGQNMPEFTVSEVSGAVKRTLEAEFGRIRVKGEVGRVVKARSGHMYFDVKDDRNTLACTTWKGQVARLSVIPEEGMEVVVTGRLTAYGAQSKYNLNVDEVAVAGQGALMALLEKRKKQLAAEGLFDSARKKELPFLPDIIGVVTSPSGAVIRDILHRLRDRFPRKVLIWPVAVQGAACAPEVARAIVGFNALTPGGALPRPDLLIVARGGGSVEDLWGFNEESVARAAAASDIPLISAVGHETDTTLIDYVSDKRAPTPTAAAELAVPVRLELLGWTQTQGARLTRGVGQVLERRRQRLADLSRALPRSETLFATPRQRLDRASDKLEQALGRGIQARRLKLAQMTGGLKPTVLDQRLQRMGDRLAREAGRLNPALQRAIDRKRNALAAPGGRLRPRQLQVPYKAAADRLRIAVRQLGGSGQQRMARLKDRIDGAGRMLSTLGYEATLERGYAVVRAGGALVTRAKAARSAPALEIQFADGRVTLGQKPASKRGAKPKGSEDQGSLF